MVAAEAFEMRTMARLDLGKKHHQASNTEANRKRERGQVRLFVLGDYLLRLRSMPLD